MTKNKAGRAFEKVFEELDTKLSNKETYRKHKTLIVLGIAVVIGALLATIIKALLLVVLIVGIVYAYWKHTHKKQEAPITNEATENLKKQNAEAKKSDS